MQKSSGCRADPSIFLRTMIARGEPSPSVIHRDLITARTETRAHLDVAFSPSRLSQRCYHSSRSYFDDRETSAKQ